MLNILIVDDDKSVRRLYETIITKKFEDTNIVHAANGQDGLEKINDFNYSIIITDINMPIMDGITFYKKVREHHPHLTGKMCFTSGNFDSFQKFLLPEGCPHLSKPFKVTDFYNMIQAVLESDKKGANYSVIDRSKRMKRYDINQIGILKPVYLNANAEAKIHVEVTSYSKKGLGLRYQGKRLDSGTEVNVSVEALKIFDKRAEIVWSRQLNSDVRSGLFWI